MPSKTFLVSGIALASSWVPAISHPGTGLSLTMVIWGLAFVAIVVPTLFDRHRQPRFQRGTQNQFFAHVGVLLLLAILAIISSATSSEPYRALRVVSASLIGVCCLGTLPFCCRSVRETHQLIFTFVVIAMFHAVCITLLMIASFDETATWVRNLQFIPGRFHLAFKHPNQTGIAFTASIPIATGIVLSREGFTSRARICCGVAMVMMLLGIIATGSKTNILLSIFTVVGMGVLAVARESNRQRFVMKAILAPVAISVFVLVAMIVVKTLNPQAYQMTQNFLSVDDVGSQSWDTRVALWKVSIQTGLGSPWTGVGAGSYVTLMDQTYSQSHNLLIDYFRGLGVPGLLGIVLLMVLVLWQGFSTAYSDDIAALEYDPALRTGVAISAAAYLMANMTSDSMGPTTAAFLFIPVGLCFAFRVTPYAYWQERA
ncbi:MAG: O-antigen ligase family protein [Planctomycetota bacterium]